eukprot:gene23494-11967_t
MKVLDVLHEGIKTVFEAKRLLVRTINHVCKPGGSLPTSGSTTLVWPKRNMPLEGSSTRRLCVLYDSSDCEILKCYKEDARSTYTSDHASHAPALCMDALQKYLANANPNMILPYTEVTLQLAAAPLGFAIIEPFYIDHLEPEAKTIALNLHKAHHGTTIVHFDECQGVVF